MLSNYFNPDTPFNSLLLFHGLGTGKTCCAINIASKFYDQVKKYNTQIYILVPGPILKESWINEIKNPICSNIKDVQNRQLFELFNIMSYKAFNKRVLGEKIKNKNIKDGKYKRNEEGEILRNESYNKISSLDNTLLIVDEAHNITNNDYGLAVKKMAEVSKNLKILLLTGTPMKNAADDLITLLDIMNTVNDKKHKSNLNEIMGSVLERICPQCNEKYTRFVSDDNFCADDFDPNKPEIMQTGFACDIDTNRIVYFSLCPRCGYKFWQDGRQRKDSYNRYNQEKDDQNN